MKANTICKYSKCNLGKDGGRKHYYACAYCAATDNWKAIACCKEHYDLYVQEVLAEREKGNEPDTLPDRTDMTKSEVKALRKKPLKKVKEQTLNELKDYADEDGNIDINEAVKKINEEIDEKAKKGE